MKLRRVPSAAFTLVELLVSLGVLGLLILVIAQLFNGATMTATGSRKHLDADSVARGVFDRMAADFERMLKRPDVDYDFLAGQTGTSDSMYFYAETPGYPGASGTQASTVSLVGYRINSQYQLERLGQRLAWTGAGAMTYLNSAGGGSSGIIANDFASVITATDPTSANYFYNVVGDGVFRMEVCFLLSDGSFSNSAYLSPHTAVDGTGMKDVVAVVVALAVLDPASKRITEDSSGMPQLSTAAQKILVPITFTGTTSSPLMDSSWNSDWVVAINNHSTGLSPAAASQVRIYQRYFYLNTK
jgi:type II secretory pathway pseudopilin PulG